MNTPPLESELREFFDYREQCCESERKRIAREIHDDLGQRLVALRMEIFSMKRDIYDSTLTRKDKIDAIIGQIDAAVQSVKTLVNGLRPAVLDLGLVASLHWQSIDFTRTTNIACTFESNCEEIVLDDTESTAIFRIFQEALTNIYKHAKATNVCISLKKGQNDFTLSIRDNGIGMPTNRNKERKSFGITGMRERIIQSGGSFTISAGNPGTVLTFKLPLSEKDH